MLVDESIDISTSEQVSISVRFIDDTVLREEFLGFHKTVFTTGEDLAIILIDCLKEYGVDTNNLRGQGYDWASNMSGCYKGTKALIQDICPL